MKCTKCQDTGWFEPKGQRGTIHRYRCDVCCKHDQGRWQLLEHYGENNGKWCCKAGCGKTWDSPADCRACKAPLTDPRYTYCFPCLEARINLTFRFLAFGMICGAVGYIVGRFQAFL